MKWTTKNGDEIEVRDMTTQHIKNCIKAIKEERIVIGENIDIGYTCDGDGDGITYAWLDNGDIYIRAFEEELKKRKEMIKMKIETGEYIRTKDGIIAKCIEEKQDRYIFNRIVLEQGYYNNYILKDIPERANFITKHSKNIIDLVEVGDYVNGKKVISIDWGTIETKGFEFIEPKDFKTIVTKQQFNNIEYRV